MQKVKVDELAKNPFRREIFMVNVKESSDTEKGDSDVDTDVIRQQQLWQQTKSMQLLGIMTTEAGNCCMIDDRILYKGDSIRGFKVSQISNSSVKLIWGSKLAPALQEPDKERLGAQSEGLEIVLKLSE